MKEKEDKISQNQFYDIITSRKPDWQSMIYELIHTEQLNPWDINIITLTQKYFEKIHEMEETDFYVSSKILLAAALLLRIKSEFLLNRDIKSIDEALFGEKQEKQEPEEIEIDQDELPLLIPKTPLPRQKKVTLPELMGALNKAMKTENRRIKREVNTKRAQKMSQVDIPKFRRVNLKDRIKQFYSRVLTSLKKKPKPKQKVGFTEIAGKQREEKLASFLPILHLSNNKKLWLEQEKHLEEIWVYLYEHFLKNKENFYEELEKDIEEIEEIEDAKTPKQKKGLEKAREKRQQKKILQKEIKKELEKELNSEINETKEEEEIEEITGFSDE